MTVIEDALKKLGEGSKAKITDRHAQVIKTYVHNALCGFCEQDEQFAAAVCQGGELVDCLKHCTEGIKGSGISDIDIYRRAVQFYFPGATVDFHISIAMAGNETIISEEPLHDKTALQKAETEKTTTVQPAQTQQVAKKERKKTTKPKPENIIQLDLFQEV